DATTGHLVKSLTSFGAHVQAIAFSADGRMLAASSRDGTIQIWDAALWQKLAALTDPMLGNGILSLVFSPKSHCFATCGSGVTLWRIQADGVIQETGSRLRIQPIARPSNDISAWNLAFSPDGELLAWVEAEEYRSTSNTLHLWDLPNSRER